jgi:hypothetical protein
VILAGAGAIFALAAAGCCNMPVASSATGAVGAFVRAIPEQGGLHAQAMSGLARPLGAASPNGWPPEVLHDRCTSGQNEVQALEQALGVKQIACPKFQLARAPEMGTPPQSLAVPPDAGASGAVADATGAQGPQGAQGAQGAGALQGAGEPETPVGFDVRCYPVGSVLLVVEATERLGDCSHIVGLAVFKKEP